MPSMGSQHQGGPSSPQLNNFMVENEDSGVNSSVQELIDMAKKDLEKNKEDHRKRKSSAKGKFEF